MAGGRPRTVTPEPEELIKLGQELVTWASEPTKELRCRFAQWYSIVKGITHYQWDKMVEKEEFRGYYEKAQTYLGQRYIDGSVKEGIAHRFLRRYCPEVKHEENEEMEQKAKANKAAEASTPQKLVLEVNYPSGIQNQIQVSPQIIPDTDTSSSQ